MREIKFRGKKWNADLERLHFVEGYLIDYNVIIDKFGNTHVVHADTIGQFTGLKDKNGTEIYEGDLFAPDTTNEEVKSVVRWDEDFAKFVVDSYGYNFHIGEGSQEVYDNELSICETNDLSDIILEYCEVIGNIYTTHDKGKEESHED